MFKKNEKNLLPGAEPLLDDLYCEELLARSWINLKESYNEEYTTSPSVI